MVFLHYGNKSPSNLDMMLGERVKSIIHITNHIYIYQRGISDEMHK